jgi:hypothetical protein
VSRISVIFAGAAALAILTAVLSLGWYSQTKEELAADRRQHEEILALKDDFLSLRDEVRLVEGKKNLTNVKGIVDAVDNVFNLLGLKEKIHSVKPLSTKEKNEERAEVEVRGVSMNEMVNILYSFENSPMPLVTRKINVKTSFENPLLLNMTMTLSLIVQG